MKAIVNVPICGLYREPSMESNLEDEVLYGMIVDVFEITGTEWCRIRTHYQYEGFVDLRMLLIDDDTASFWGAMPKKVVFYKNFCDVLSAPRVQSVRKITLPRGACLRALSEPENGWQSVVLVDGSHGYVPEAILREYRETPISDDEAVLRKALTDTVMLYKGTHYRWGGKSTMGIDCSGLCSMAYMLCGILIFRDSKIKEGFPIHEIALEAIKPGDLIFFPGHVAMYLGDGKYCHCTAKSGYDGFTVNSLNPSDEDYREDLHKTITAVGSYF